MKLWLNSQQVKPPRIRQWSRNGSLPSLWRPPLQNPSLTSRNRHSHRQLQWFLPNPFSLLHHRQQILPQKWYQNLHSLWHGLQCQCTGHKHGPNLLKVHKNSNAVVLSTEILSTGWYPGKDKSMLALNCLFRMAVPVFYSVTKEKWKIWPSISCYRVLDHKGHLMTGVITLPSAKRTRMELPVLPSGGICCRWPEKLSGQTSRI